MKVISTEVDDLKRRLIKVLRMGKADIQTPIEASQFGYDSNCPKDFIAVYATTEENGKNVIIGYINKNSLAKVGESRIYSTNEKGNIEKMYLLLTNDGYMEIGGDTNWAVKYTEMKREFDKLKTDFNNHITEYNLHTHSGGILSMGLTGPPSAPSTNINTSDMSQAKNDKLKTIG